MFRHPSFQTPPFHFGASIRVRILSRSGSGSLVFRLCFEPINHDCWFLVFHSLLNPASTIINHHEWEIHIKKPTTYLWFNGCWISGSPHEPMLALFMAPRAMTSRPLLDPSTRRTMRTKRKTRMVDASCTCQGPQLVEQGAPHAGGPHGWTTGSNQLWVVSNQG